MSARSKQGQSAGRAQDAASHQSGPSALEVQGLTVAYDAKPVLWNVDLVLKTGVMMGVVGPNGAGKSTLLKAALGILPRLAGRVQLFGETLTAKVDSKRRASQLAYVPQRSSVDWDFPTTVFDVVLMGTYGSLGWLRRPGKREREQAMEALAMVDMTHLAKRQISELSVGQQQRVFLARALVQDAALYFMDEPFAGVDAKTEETLVRLLQSLRDAGKTLMVVHHDLSTVESYFDEVALINRQMIACGPTEEAFTQSSLEATYGGSIGQLRARFAGTAEADQPGSAPRASE